MNWFQNLTIRSKVIGPIAVLALIILGGTAFTVTEMRSMDSSYSSFIDKDAVSWVDAVRLRLAGAEISRLSYRLVLESDQATMRSLAGQIDQTEGEFRKYAPA
ncbi:MAG: hypothetical protein BGN85_12345 [Alphaproteobacteria bacterium 64-11]|nr:MCP four helix bundle domain-containing protein [Alphaproteobacteria bacterium]OJU12313.1 MAG: hypothetical protein BGN85_12345 [Alphaproteobacteria bacterium 64-11]